MISKIFNIIWIALFGGHIHEWEQWSEPKVWSLIEDIQKRKCTKCGEYQTRLIDGGIDV